MHKLILYCSAFLFMFVDNLRRGARIVAGHFHPAQGSSAKNTERHLAIVTALHRRSHPMKVQPTSCYGVLEQRKRIELKMDASLEH